ncbi:MAG: acyl-CoA dehydrogenase family protein [Gammaproteobacteria bacterium]|nr:acyl-CoA dehydrogenase family protein [Gammaproteobacteria bacterium]
MDFSLSTDQLQLQQVAHEFARKQIRPMAAEYDGRSDPKEAFPWEIYEKGNEIGFNKALIPEAFGGPGLGNLDLAIIIEELAWGDAGVALTYLAHWLALRPLINGGTDEQRSRFLAPVIADTDGHYLAAIAATEHGTAGDLSPRDHLRQRTDQRVGVTPEDFATNYTIPAAERRESTTTARLDGDHYVINGTKRFITNGPVASVYLVTATMDPSKPDAEATGCFMVAANTPGISIGKIENKMGHRLSKMSEVLFEDVCIPSSDRIPTEATIHGLASSTTNVGALCVGLARAAYEEALSYAKARYKGGNRIIFHQAISMKLADMAIGIKTGRLLTHLAAWENDQGKPLGASQYMAKVYCSDMALKVTLEAQQIFGGYGYMRDFPVEKWVRDARVCPIYDFTNEMLRVNHILPSIAFDPSA